MKKIIPILFYLLSIGLYAQVGVGTTNPQSALDIEASNVTNPANSDGILVPRVANFPTTDPTAAQDGMLLFYTGTSRSGKGFYYWNQSITDWVFIASGSKNTLDQAYDEGGAGVGRSIIADNGAVNIQGTDGLRVEGDIAAASDIVHDGDNDTFIRFNPDRIQMEAGNWSYINIQNANQEITFNEDGRTIDFRVESDTNQNMLFVNGTNSRVGIGTNTPGNPLHIGLRTTFNTNIGNTGQDGIFIRGNNVTGLNAVGGSISFGGAHPARENTRRAAIASMQTGVDEDNVGLAFYVHQGPVNTDPMVEAMRITHQRYLGINNTSPSANLDVIGSLQFEDGNEAAGYVLSSDADGNASWTDPNTLISESDDQNIQNLSFNSTTNILTVGIENGTSQNVDLSDLDSGGDINQVNAGDGLTGGGTIGNVTLNAVGINGITTNANDFRLGGALIQNTTITNGTNNFVINANNSGTFRLQDNGINKFEMNNVGDAVFGGDLYVRDGTSNAASTILARIIDSNDDGVLDIYQGGAIANRIHGNGTSYFNGGKVAIGQTTADGFLDILADNTGAEPHINLVDNGATGARINFTNTATTNGNVWTLYGDSDNTAANSRFNLFHSGTGNIMVVTGNGNVGIGDTTPDATLDVNGSFQYTDGNQVNGYVLRTDANGSASWVNPNTLGVVSAVNGLTATGNQIRLGGSLTQNTTITQNTFDLIHTLNSTGEFIIRDGTLDVARVDAGGILHLGDDTYWRDGNATGGTIIAQMIDDGDDGWFRIMENGSVAISLDANSGSVFNEQGLDRDFRIESDANSNMLFVDASTNRVAVGANTTAGTFNVTGNSYHSDDIYLRDGAVNGGDILVRIFDSADDGIIDVYENNAMNHRIHGNGTTVFNEQGNNNADFRIESDTRANMFLVDASDNVVRVGHAAGGLPQQGASKTVTSPSGTQTFNVNYIANFQAGSGSTVGLGTAEFITDGGNQVLMMDANLIPFNDNDDSLGFSGYRWTSLWATNGTINTSDLTLKKDIKPLDYGLDQLMNVETITYKWKDGKTDDTKIGFSAQNLQQILPEVVRDYDLVKPDEKGSEAVKVQSSVLGVYYSDIIPVTVKAIQELNAKVEKLEAENLTLKQQLSKLQLLEERLLALENKTKDN